MASTPFGHVTYRGVPLVPLADISGSWYGVKKLKNKETFNEFFTMTSAGQNIYDVTGAGPDYSYTGSAILSAQKKIAFVFGMTPIPATDPVTVVRAVVGSFNAKKVSGATHGWDQPDGPFTDPMRFDAFRLAPLD